MKRYSINGCVEMNSTAFYMLLSFPITIGLVAIFLFFDALIDSVWHIDLLKIMPHGMYISVNVLGAYAGLSCFALYAIMWIYLLSCEKGKLISKVIWGLSLLLGLFIGAVVYSLKVVICNVSEI